MSNGIACRKFDLTVISAKNLPNIRTSESKNKILAKVTMLDGDESTHADKQNGLNPSWYYKFNYIVPESNIMDDRPVVIKLYSHRKLKDDIYIGEVQTSIKYLFDLASKGTSTLALPVKCEVKTGGLLNISYSFGESFGVEPISKKKAVWNLTKRVGKGLFKLAAGELLEAGIDHFRGDDSGTKSPKNEC